mgnify:FL=1
MVLVEVNLSALFFFLLGFFSAAAIIIALMIIWVILPKVTEGRKFFELWLKMKRQDKSQVKLGDADGR